MGNCAGKRKAIQRIPTSKLTFKVSKNKYNDKGLAESEICKLKEWQARHVPQLYLLKNSLYKRRAELLNSRLHQDH